MQKGKQMPKYLDMEVSLIGIKPKIWRRFLIQSTASFQHLHSAIQVACGWWDYHLFEFQEKPRGRPIARADYEEPWDEKPAPVAKRVKLSSYFRQRGDTCIYIYDFGDDWHHLVTLKEIVELPEKFRRRLLDGARSFPREDCGGVWGYGSCLKALGILEPEKDDDREDLAQRKDWLGDWHPEAFELAEVKSCFDR